jgi:lysophospholipase L1-like esterase
VSDRERHEHETTPARSAASPCRDDIDARRRGRDAFIPFGGVSIGAQADRRERGQLGAPMMARLRSARARHLLAVAILVMGAAGCVPRSYVALGDSYTAGPVIPNQRLDYPGCLRSDQNYPALIAPVVAQPAFRDASCSGAQTKHMTQPQDVDPNPDNPPQFDRLDAETRVVTIGIGGNDIGFTEIAESCASPTPTGTPCQDRYVVNGDDTISDRIAAAAPKVGTVLEGIRTRAPSATVYVVGYPAILPEQGPGCWPTMPITPGDVPYLRAKEKELNTMLANQAAAHRATYVDTYTPSIGHDACQLPTVRWVEPVVPVNPAAPIHPNAAGMRGMADAVLAAMRVQLVVHASSVR